MYVNATAACSLPNSETPLTPRQLAAEAAFTAAVGRRFMDGNRVLGDLILDLGSLYGGSPLGLSPADAGRGEATPAAPVKWLAPGVAADPYLSRVPASISLDASNRALLGRIRVDGTAVVPAVPCSGFPATVPAPANPFAPAGGVGAWWMVAALAALGWVAHSEGKR